MTCSEIEKQKKKNFLSEFDDFTFFRYMIHFKEWSKSFDRWVDKNLLLKVTPENKKIQRDLFIKIIKENGDRDGLKMSFSLKSPKATAHFRSLI